MTAHITAYTIGPAGNVTTIVTGLISCDPVRRTPWV